MSSQGCVHISCCHKNILHISSFYNHPSPLHHTYVGFPLEDTSVHLDPPGHSSPGMSTIICSNKLDSGSYLPDTSSATSSMQETIDIVQMLNFSESFGSANASLDLDTLRKLHCLKSYRLKPNWCNQQTLSSSESDSVGMLSETSSLSISTLGDLTIPSLLLPQISSDFQSLDMVSDEKCPKIILDISHILPLPTKVLNASFHDDMGDDWSEDEVDVDADSTLYEDQLCSTDIPSQVPHNSEESWLTSLESRHVEGSEGSQKDPYKTSPQYFDSQDKVHDWLASCNPSAELSSITCGSDAGIYRIANQAFLSSSSSSKSLQQMLPGSGNSPSMSSRESNASSRAPCMDSDSAVHLERSVIHKCGLTCKITSRKHRKILKTLCRVGIRFRKRNQSGSRTCKP